MLKTDPVNGAVLICKAARKISDVSPYSDRERQATTHYTTVKIGNLPANLPIVPTLRKPNARGRICAMIRRTLKDDPGNFLHRNRGLVLVVPKVKFKEKLQDSSIEITLSFEDENGDVVGGVADGAQTYEVLKGFMDPKKKRSEVCVKVQIIEGVLGEDAENIAESVRANAQAQDYTMEIPKDEFSPVKEALGRYAKYVEFGDREEPPDSPDAATSVLEVLALMTALDKEGYPDSRKNPHVSQARSACYRRWQKSRKSYERLYPLLPSIIELHEHLHKNFRTYYNASQLERAASGFLELQGIRNREYILPFSKEKMDHEVSRAYLMPILASLRFLLVVDKDGKWKWKTDPKAILDEHGPELVFMLLDYNKEKNDPQASARDKFLWTCLALRMQAA